MRNLKEVVLVHLHGTAALLFLWLIFVRGELFPRFLAGESLLLLNLIRILLIVPNVGLGATRRHLDVHVSCFEQVLDFEVEEEVAQLAHDVLFGLEAHDEVFG